MADYYLYPDTTISTGASWGPVGAATVHQAIDDLQGAPDDDTTYAQGSAASWDDLICGLGPMVDAIEILSVTMVIRYNNAGGGANQEIDFGLRIGSTNYLNGSIAVSSSTYADASKTWTTNPATSGVFTKGQLDEIQIIIRTQDAGVPPIDSVRVTQAYLKVVYQPLGAGVVPARGVLSHRLRRYREEIPKIALTSRLDLADNELIDNVSVSHFELPTIKVDGDPYGIEPWERHLFMIAEEEIDLNRKVITHQLHDQRPFLCLLWYTGESRVSSSPAEDGVALLTTGGAVTLTRASKMWWTDPASGLVVEGGTNAKPIAAGGFLSVKEATNSLRQSSCVEGATSVAALPAMTGSGTFAEDAAPPDPYFDPAVSGYAYRSTKGSPHTTTQVQPWLTTAGYPANTKVRVWFVYQDDPSGVDGDRTRWRLTRSSDGNYWNDSTPGWQAGAVDNAAPLSTDRAIHLSNEISVGVGISIALTLSFVKNSGGTAGFESWIYHAQIENSHGVTAPIVTTSAAVSRAAQTMAFAHDIPSKPIWNNAFGAFEIEVEPLSSAADIASYGANPTVFKLYYDANNGWQGRYNSATGNLEFICRVAGAQVQATIAWSPVKGTAAKLGFLWIGAAGELGETPYTIAVFLDGARGTDAVRAGHPTEADGQLYVGSDETGGNAFNGYWRRVASLQFCLTEEEIAGFRP